MTSLSVPERPENDAPPHECTLVPARRQRRPPVSHADLARFVRDPLAFAANESGDAPEAFVRAYLKGLESRLSEALSAPPRLATLPHPAAEAARGIGLRRGEPHDDLPGPGDHGPQMAGAVVLALAVVTVALATAAAACASVLAKRDAN